MIITMSDLVQEAERRARKELISKMDEQRKWKNVHNEGRTTED
jgi:hypothetical protein